MTSDAIYHKSIENHKQKLESETAIHTLSLDKDLEIFKGNLNKLSFEHQTKYQQLHTDRAETIKKLFGFTVRIHLHFGLRKFIGIILY